MLTWDRKTNQYNELIVDGDHWTKHLPGIIEAFVYSPAEPQSQQRVAQVHSRFLQAYGLNADQVPRAAFNDNDAREPFS